MACGRPGSTSTSGGKVGTLYVVDAFLPPTYYFRGAELELDETHYRIKDGLFASCPGSPTTPHRGASTSTRATLEVGRYGHFRGVSMRAQGVPVFHPRLLWPIKRDRAAGFLVPNFGFNDRHGAYPGNRFFWPVSRSLDTTFYLDLYSENYVGIGDELRWAPPRTPVAPIGSTPSATRRPTAGSGKPSASTVQLFAGGFSIKGQIDETSDFDFFRRFERSADRNTRPDLFSFLTLSRTWGAQSVNLRSDHRRRLYETPTGQTTAPPDLVLDRLAEVEYRLRSTRVGRHRCTCPWLHSPMPSGSSGPKTLKGPYGRVDVFPTVSLLTSGLPWLSLTPALGGRETYYTKRYGARRLQPTGALRRRGSLALVLDRRALPRRTLGVSDPGASRQATSSSTSSSPASSTRTFPTPATNASSRSSTRRTRCWWPIASAGFWPIGSSSRKARPAAARWRAWSCTRTTRSPTP